MAVKIQLPLIMQYLMNIGNNSAQTDTACLCTAVLIVDSITPLPCSILFVFGTVAGLSQKREWTFVILSKMEVKKQQVGLSI
jgi:hypothetical protein